MGAQAPRLERAFCRRRDGATAHYQAGHTAHLEEYPELLGAFSAFENYYDVHLTNTLHNNPDGDDLAAIVIDGTRDR